jgi:lysyl-tRNA synthetase class 1
MTDLYERLAKLPKGSKGDDIQTLVYEIGKAHEFEPLRDWFQGLYEVLLGQSQGPRFGPFVELYGIAETRALIARTLGLEEKKAAVKKTAAKKPGAKAKKQAD